MLSVTRRTPILTHILPVVDLLLALGCVSIAPECTNFIAPYLGWDINQAFNAFAASPLMVGLALAGVPVTLRMVGFYHRGNLQRNE